MDIPLVTDLNFLSSHKSALRLLSVIDLSNSPSKSKEKPSLRTSDTADSESILIASLWLRIIQVMLRRCRDLPFFTEHLHSVQAYGKADQHLFRLFHFPFIGRLLKLLAHGRQLGKAVILSQALQLVTQDPHRVQVSFPERSLHPGQVLVHFFQVPGDQVHRIRIRTNQDLFSVFFTRNIFFPHSPGVLQDALRKQRFHGPSLKISPRTYCL